MFERIKDRYLKNFVRDDQLQRYVELQVVTQEQADKIRASK